MIKYVAEESLTVVEWLERWVMTQMFRTQSPATIPSARSLAGNSTFTKHCCTGKSKRLDHLKLSDPFVGHRWSIYFRTYPNSATFPLYFAEHMLGAATIDSYMLPQLRPGIAQMLEYRYGICITSICNSVAVQCIYLMFNSIVSAFSFK